MAGRASLRRDAIAQVVHSHRARLRARWQARRQGRTDGRFGCPDPIRTYTEVTTEYRRELQVRLDGAVHAVRRARDRLNETTSRRHAELTAERDRLHAAVVELAGELAAEDARRPDPNAPPERRRGETSVPELVVRARRMREHTARCAALRERRFAKQDKLIRAESAHSACAAELEQRSRVATHAERQLLAAYGRLRSLYDQALLRRHPQRELLTELLDQAPLTIPAEARTVLAGRTVR